MAEKDHLEKKLEDYEDVFADIINVLLFNGKRTVLEEDLESGMARSAYKVEGTFEEQERDAKKFWKSGQVRIAVYGIENQTGVDSEFTFRGISYDGADYRDQLHNRHRIRRENTRRVRDGLQPLPVPDFYPVVTLLLYFGDSRWTGSVNLKDHLVIPEGLKDYVPDYKVNLFEIAYLTDEQVQMFQSDFRYVAEYFVGNRKKKEGLLPEFNYPLDKMKHMTEVIALLNALTNSRRFDRIAEIPDLGRGRETMNTFIFEDIERKAEIKGAILTYDEMGMLPSDIEKKIMRRFDLKPKEAEDYIKNVLKAELV